MLDQHNTYIHIPAYSASRKVTRKKKDVEIWWTKYIPRLQLSDFFLAKSTIVEYNNCREQVCIIGACGLTYSYNDT